MIFWLLIKSAVKKDPDIHLKLTSGSLVRAPNTN